MVAARTAAGGLSTVDLEQIRDMLAAGRKPKVMFTDAAGQIAGQLGQVIELTDPELSDEWVVVRFGKDELPFSPTDLIIAPKTSAQRRSPATAVPAPREETTVTPPPPSIVDVEIPAAPARPAETAAPAESKESKKAAAAAAAAPPAAVNGARPAADVAAKKPAVKKATKGKAPADLIVTLTYGDGEWSVGATQGPKTLAKPYVIKPSEALKMVALLDVPTVHEAVEEIVTAARHEAEEQAERLRAELAELETRLAELRDAG